jgi:glyceraldehyde-3-phosphate dehydrogenase (NADP+)
MKFWKAAVTLALSISSFDTVHASTCKTSSQNDSTCAADLEVPPFVAPLLFAQGSQVIPVDSNVLANANDENTNTNNDKTPVMPITGCCSSKPIGEMPQMSTEQSLQILSDAKQGWNHGNGAWTQMTLAQRISAIQSFVSELQQSRDEIIHVLMYEIGKNYKDAASEFDRTIIFVEETIQTILSSPAFSSEFHNVPSTNVNVMIRRNAFGIILALGPYNYPLNETYATIIPALLMGNVVILKIPQIGGLAHLLTFQAFSRALPPNTINFISGSGRKTLPKLMESGDVDGLAFIGGTEAADKLIKGHPEPHRLKLFVQLEAKNMAIVLKDMLDEEQGSYPNQKMMGDIITGALSFNGQRCTALKIIFVPKGYGKKVAKALAKKVESLTIGMPWEIHESGAYSQITPLPNQKRVQYMQALVDDALSKGAIIANKNGGKVGVIDAKTEQDDESSPHDASTLMVPAILYNVTPDMKLYTEEQFGPLVPVVEYDSIDEVLAYGLYGNYGQQVSVFTNQASSEAVSIVDTFSAVYGKININSQCGRSPDSVPFTARRSSGMGIMSIEDALKEFSIPTVVSYKHEDTKSVIEGIRRESKFMKRL